jgi:hypothetical protein
VTIGVEGDAGQLPLVALQDRDVPGPQVPDPTRAVVAGGREVAPVGAVGEVVDPVLMTGEVM